MGKCYHFENGAVVRQSEGIVFRDDSWSYGIHKSGLYSRIGKQGSLREI